MTRWRVKSSPTYKGPFDLSPEQMLAAMRRYKTAREKPTSVTLDERTLKELKALAAHQGIPYQALMRVFILRGIESMKQAS
jgi:predicted DNA binding CopG/RHH family protein